MVFQEGAVIRLPPVGALYQVLVPPSGEVATGIRV